MITIGDNGHKLRLSDSSLYDFICEYCGANDGYLSSLDDKCPGPRVTNPFNLAKHCGSYACQIETPHTHVTKHPTKRSKQLKCQSKISK